MGRWAAGAGWGLLDTYLTRTGTLSNPSESSALPDWREVLTGIAYLGTLTQLNLRYINF